MTDHLRPTAGIAPAALLPGDPGRALALAQDLLESPKMANHARGLWGYTAATAAGDALTIQSTGIGGPSVAIVLSELASLGVERAVRIGTCRPLAGLVPGALVVATGAIRAGSNGAGAPVPVAPDPGLTAALLAGDGGPRPVLVAGTDRYYADGDLDDARAAAGAEVVDLGTETTLDVGWRLGMAVASALVVTGPPGETGLSDAEVEAASLALGRMASAALAA